jgi:hypothetical protein
MGKPKFLLTDEQMTVYAKREAVATWFSDQAFAMTGEQIYDALMLELGKNGDLPGTYKKYGLVPWQQVEDESERHVFTQVRDTFMQLSRVIAEARALK